MGLDPMLKSTVTHTNFTYLLRILLENFKSAAIVVRLALIYNAYKNMIVQENREAKDGKLLTNWPRVNLKPCSILNFYAFQLRATFKRTVGGQF